MSLAQVPLPHSLQLFLASKASSTGWRPTLCRVPLMVGPRQASVSHLSTQEGAGRGERMGDGTAKSDQLSAGGSSSSSAETPYSLKRV